MNERITWRSVVKVAAGGCVGRSRRGPGFSLRVRRP
ncbi:hypothetical protein WG66_006661 [Moniliophthora roreri]|nr:hypothetical protein WG66_006661 [Moniliophthora roreri]